MKEILYITEEHNDTVEWFLSVAKPEFQGGKTIAISEEDAQEILSLLNK